MAIVDVFKNLKITHLLCATGLVVAAAGTAYLVRRLRERAEPEEDKQHLESLDDPNADGDHSVSVESLVEPDTDGDQDPILDEMIEEDDGHLTASECRSLPCHPLVAVTHHSLECQAASRSSTFNFQEKTSRDMLVFEVSLEHSISISGSEVLLLGKKKEEMTELSPNVFPVRTRLTKESTTIKLVEGQVVCYASTCIVDIAEHTPFYNRVQTDLAAGAFVMGLGLDGVLVTDHWADIRPKIQPKERNQDDSQGDRATKHSRPKLKALVPDFSVSEVSLEHSISISGSEVLLLAKKKEEMTELSPNVFPVRTRLTKESTTIKLVAGQVVCYASTCIVDIAEHTPFYNRVQTDLAAGAFVMGLGLDGVLVTDHWADIRTKIQPKERNQDDSQGDRATKHSRPKLKALVPDFSVSEVSLEHSISISGSEVLLLAKKKEEMTELSPNGFPVRTRLTKESTTIKRLMSRGKKCFKQARAVILGRLRIANKRDIRAPSTGRRI